eukprot:4429730-Prymnesium_polylepis.1
MVLNDEPVEAGPAGGGGIRVTPSELFEDDDPRHLPSLEMQRGSTRNLLADVEEAPPGMPTVTTQPLSLAAASAPSAAPAAAPAAASQAAAQSSAPEAAATKAATPAVGAANAIAGVAFADQAAREAALIKIQARQRGRASRKKTGTLEAPKRRFASHSKPGE